MNKQILIAFCIVASIFVAVECSRRPRRQISQSDPCGVLICKDGERCARVAPSCSSCPIKGVCVTNDVYQQQYASYQQPAGQSYDPQYYYNYYQQQHGGGPSYNYNQGGAIIP